MQSGSFVKGGTMECETGAGGLEATSESRTVCVVRRSFYPNRHAERLLSEAFETLMPIFRARKASQVRVFQPVKPRKGVISA